MPVNITKKVLAQRVPVTAVATLLYQPPEDLRAEIKTIIVANTTASAATFSLYLDADGTIASSSTALYESVSIAANSTVLIALEGDASLSLESSASSISCKSGTASALTFTLFGLEIEET